MCFLVTKIFQFIKNKCGRVLNKYSIENKDIFIDPHLGKVN